MTDDEFDGCFSRVSGLMIGFLVGFSTGVIVEKIKDATAAVVCGECDLCVANKRGE